MTWKNESCLFGSMVWGGTYDGYPAVVSSYHGGASLYIFKNGEWKQHYKGKIISDAIPRRCGDCGITMLPYKNT